MKTLQTLRSFIDDEEQSFAWVIELHKRASTIIAYDRHFGPMPTVKELMDILQIIEQVVLSMGIDLTQMDAGHGSGHLVRDYITSILLARKLSNSPTSTIATAIAGTFHDIGCTLLPRYKEDRRAVRHAEAGAILMEEVLKHINLPERVMDLTVLSIAAHTHYQQEMSVLGEDGKTRVVKPFLDVHPNEAPVMAIWGTRQIDRCDTNGPTFVGRHYLTLGVAHKDFWVDTSGKGHFYDVQFRDHLLPVLRNEQEILQQGGKRSMLEHLEMFRMSQNNASVYGRHDGLAMKILRDPRTEALGRIIATVKAASTDIFDELTTASISRAWTEFLRFNIEPYQAVGMPVALALETLFNALPVSVRRAWSAGFAQTMIEYVKWYQDVIDLLNLEGVNLEGKSYFDVDISSMLKPHPSWLKVITG